MMKKTFMALALTLLPFGMASAQVRMLVVPKDGTAPKSFNLDDIRRIDFLGEANTFSIACSRLSLPHYDGQPIDVSALPKGAYILRVGDKAFKFLR